MSSAASPLPVDEGTFSRDTTIGTIARTLRRKMTVGNRLLAILLVAEVIKLFVVASPGAASFSLMALASMLALFGWASDGIGLPLLPMIVIQHLLTYGLPVVVGNTDIMGYSPDEITQGGVEVFVMIIAMTVSWRFGLATFRVSRPWAYVLRIYDKEGLSGLGRIGYPLIILSTLWLVIGYFGPTQFIPALVPGAFAPVVSAATSATGACGFFLTALLTGAGGQRPSKVLLFWVLLSVNCLIGASAFLLSGPATCLCAAIIGLFWGSGRVPWRTITLAAFILAFLSAGKWTMRERYWRVNTDDPIPIFELTDMPGHYVEWAQASLDALTADPAASANQWKSSAEGRPTNQSLLTRLNNLGNLLYVEDAMEHGHVEPLHGATYIIIPSLLIPRFLWPDKPRTHEGQVLLNVTFGRQNLQSTLGTYIAWGLLPEAYANYGPILGGLLLGIVLGLFCAWIEAATASKPLLSTEGFVAFIVFIGMANSFEMVSGVMLASIFQSIIPVVAACAPFVRRQNLQQT